jgi:hypothetical protein
MDKTDRFRPTVRLQLIASPGEGHDADYSEFARLAEGMTYRRSQGSRERAAIATPLRAANGWRCA